MDKFTVALAPFNLDRPTLRRAEFFLRQAEPKTRPGSGFALNGGLNALAAICALLACESTKSDQVSEQRAQAAACLAPRAFKMAVLTVRSALGTSMSPTKPSDRKHNQNSSPTKALSPVKSTSSPQVDRPAAQLSFEQICNWHRIPYSKVERQANAIWEYLENRKWPEWESTRNETRVAILWWICKNLEGLSELPPLRVLTLNHKVNLKTLERVVRILDSRAERIHDIIQDHTEKQGEDIDTEDTGHAPDDSMEEAPLTTDPDHGDELMDDSPTKKRRKLDNAEKKHDEDASTSKEPIEPEPSVSSRAHAQVQTPMKSALKRTLSQRDSSGLSTSPTKSVRISVSPSKRARRRSSPEVQSDDNEQGAQHVRPPKRYRPVFPDREFYRCSDN
ncbi:hypothetical protein FRC03_004124 [Tulasnella sp. 419]|nr:hypothetical protein FRC02_007221 [Tulasnella sp. 418]KAG8969171.1 hypothetical protein FRC03_004124 [Tulasnella sp. 419]